MVPDPMQKTERRRPVEANTRRMSAANRRSGTARGSRNLFTMEYVGESAAIRPMLLAANPTSVLTNAPLSALPHCVFSDLHKQHMSIPKLHLHDPYIRYSLIRLL